MKNWVCHIPFLRERGLIVYLAVPPLPERILGECLLPGKGMRRLAGIARLAEIKRILGECLLISSLPANALRTFVDDNISSLAERFNMHSQS